MFLNLEKNKELIGMLSKKYKAEQKSLIVLTDLQEWKLGSDIDIYLDDKNIDIPDKIKTIVNVEIILFTYHHEITAVSIVGLYCGSLFYFDFYQDFQRKGKLLIDKQFFREQSILNKSNFKNLTPQGQKYYNLIKAHEKGKCIISFDEFLILKKIPSIKTFNIKKSPGFNIRKYISLIWVRYLLLKFNSYLKRYFLIIVIMGPDGTGKSSIINELAQINEKIFRKVVKIHLMPSRLISKKQIPNSNVPYTFPRPHGRFKGMLKSLWIFLEHMLEFLYQALMGRNSNLLLVDRSILDFQVDPLRYRLSKPPLVIRFILKILREKIIIFILEGEAAEVSKRKNELSEKQTAHLIKRYKKFAEIHKIRTFSTTEKSIEDITGAIQSELYKKLATK